MQTTVLGVIIKDKKILLEKRKKTEDNYADLWCLPGGHQKPDEMIDMALLREMREELDIIVNRYEELGIFNDTDPTSKQEFEHHAFHIVEWKGDIEETKEQKEIKWFTIKDFKKLKHRKIDEEIIKKVK